MITLDKQFWFCPCAEVFLSQSDDTFLLYDTRNGRHLKFTLPLFKTFVAQLHDPASRGVIAIDRCYLEDPDCNRLIEQIVEMDFAHLTEVRPSEPKPIVFLSLLHFMDWSCLAVDSHDADSHLATDYVRYLSEITLFINDTCFRRCSHCKYNCRPSEACIGYHTPAQMSPESVGSVLSQLSPSHVGDVHISGGNIFLYNQWPALLFELSRHSFTYHFWMHYRDLAQNGLSDHFFMSHQKEIICTFPVEEEIIYRTLCRYGRDRNVRFHFYVEDDVQYEFVDRIITLFRLPRYQLHPIFNGHNSKFFHKNVFLHEEDILVTRFSQQEIFRNKNVNTNYFGKLLVLPDGSVKTHHKAAPLGSIYQNTLSQLVREELIRNTAWRRVRDMAPCNACVYRYLCPPIFGYESELGQINFCHVV